MIRPPPISTLSDKLFPVTTLFRSLRAWAEQNGQHEQKRARREQLERSPRLIRRQDVAHGHGAHDFAMNHEIVALGFEPFDRHQALVIGDRKSTRLNSSP